jgi:hypothetical protein
VSSKDKGKAPMRPSIPTASLGEHSIDRD